VFARPGAREVRIAVSGRIGLSAAQDLPLRFYLEGDPYVSQGRRLQQRVID